MKIVGFHRPSHWIWYALSQLSSMIEPKRAEEGNHVCIELCARVRQLFFAFKVQKSVKISTQLVEWSGAREVVEIECLALTVREVCCAVLLQIVEGSPFSHILCIEFHHRLIAKHIQESCRVR